MTEKKKNLYTFMAVYKAMFKTIDQSVIKIEREKYLSFMSRG